MKIHHHICGRFGGRALLLLCGLSLIQPALALEGEGIIDEVQIGRGSIHIVFIEPAQVVGHTPKSKGDRLYIDLSLPGDTSTGTQQQQESYTASENMPLSQVSYRKESRGEARLELRFSHAVNFDVAARSDYRGVTVTLGSTRVRGSAKVEAEANALMEKARNALVDEKNPQKASDFYQEVIDLPENSATREAYEYMGLAQERLGNFASARGLYKEYLKRYPNGADSERVSQRLASLETATASEKKELRKAETRQEQNPWQFYGSISQYYLHDRLDTETDVNTVTSKSTFLQTDLDLNVRRRVGKSDSRFRLNAGHDADLEDNTDSGSMRYLYFEHNDRELGLMTRAGRQISSRDGVNSRFDGLRLGYVLSQAFKLTAVTGSPVDSSRDGYNDQRNFYGLALDMGPYFGNMEFTAYALNQTVGSLTDRQSIGGEARYFTQNLTVLGMYDYDTFHSETNLAMLLANWSLESGLNLSANYRMSKAPFISTNTALTSSGLTDIDDLRAQMTDDQIYQRARDITADTQNMTLGASYPVSKKLRLYADATVTSSSATDGSAAVGSIPAVEPTEASGDEYYYSLRAVGNGIFNGDDITTFGLRTFDGKTSNSTSTYLGVRMRFREKWLLYPTIQLDSRKWTTTGTSQDSTSLRMRAEYTKTENLAFEMEFGITSSSEDVLDDPTETSIGNYFSLGYHYNF